MPIPPLADSVRSEYNTLYATMVLRPEKLARLLAAITRILALRPSYDRVAGALCVPWFVIALIHALEASLNTLRHLHNGDPLENRTVHVPAGRPMDGAPPFAWEDSATDALRLHGLDRWRDWSLAGIAHALETYNGLGYRLHHPQVKSPYLWAGTNHYSAGKYATDGRFDANLVSQQLGAMPLLAKLAEQVPQIAANLAVPPLAVEVNPTRFFPATDEQAPPSPAPTAAPAFPGYRSVTMRAADIPLIKARLRQFGCDPGSNHDRFDATTGYAVRLFQARSCEPSGQPLTIDGIVGPRTWQALFGSAAAPSAPRLPTGTGAKILAVAQDEIGVREQPLGSNRGPKVDAYLASVGVPPGQPWCAAFVHWCYGQALGTENPLPRTGLVQELFRQSKTRTDLIVIPGRSAAKSPARIAPGMVFCIDTGGGHGHAGLVVAEHDGRLETIEGNTNEDGSREGIGVFRRSRRKVSDISLGFIGLRDA